MILVIISVWQEMNFQLPELILPSLKQVSFHDNISIRICICIYDCLNEFTLPISHVKLFGILHRVQIFIKGMAANLKSIDLQQKL